MEGKQVLFFLCWAFIFTLSQAGPTVSPPQPLRSFKINTTLVHNPHPYLLVEVALSLLPACQEEILLFISRLPIYWIKHLFAWLLI
uniref:Uncharacterized protein LOC107261136 n=1 Tax=Rhizophora mucronata TaxID=61149 RepID=A0A2P2J184_RHIMU